ncbi:uncharacterized protein A1O9_02903 [Exophiala aquamarina CBS 119918]|uniref:Xylanolytic transcriptional activator regulatory domain-containing protein n=1 Tax=Exophiala aquamarina CBS 119918 TaxID=1182545 RepID=A0A072PNN4_9EURO|nr:uncharacterized protein A1O9_02903 [Exophiala aquamarina CBS 119918]KEF61337.1 hypothetical protein A1O9_02903 [Exophiala aquamarina CBS 119918]
MAAYRYVRNLEERVVRLEEQLSKFSSSRGYQDSGALDSNVHHSMKSGDSTNTSAPEHREVNEDCQERVLEAEVRKLSLDATADRYLGSSSGVSFARLTQAVLRRLKPDQHPFTFENNLLDKLSGRNSLDGSESVKSRTELSPPQYPSCLPSKGRAYQLADYYWAHNHTLYPFLRKTWFMDLLETTYSEQGDGLFNSPSWLYTMWMVFAIGSTCWSSIVADACESESTHCYNQAMTYFFDALSVEGISALDSMLLQINYSFFNRVGANTWYLVGSAIRLAVGMGLHAPNASAKQLPMDVQEHRKRIFWSLYMADRVVSISLGRPLGIRDDDIEVGLFSAVDDECIFLDKILPQPQLRRSDLAVPLHVLALRRIASQIFDQVYSNRNRQLATNAQDEVFSGLHTQLLDWRRTIPFPLPQCQSLRIPHTSTSWYDYNYYLHLIMLYRPSPLCPVLTLEKVKLIADAAAMAIRHIEVMHNEQRYSYNWITLFNVFSVALTLIYSITAQPDPLTIYLGRSDALSDLQRASRVLGNFAQKFPTVVRCLSIVQGVSQRLRALMNSAHVSDAKGESPDDAYPRYAIGPELVSGMHSATPESVQTGATSFPSFVTGNRLFDELQNRVSSTTYVERPAVISEYEKQLPTISESGLPPNFRLAATMAPYGDATAQFMAIGIGSNEATAMDLEQVFMNFLDGTLS